MHPLSHYLHPSYNHPTTRAWISKLPSPSSLVYPIFVSDQPDELTPFKTMPEIYRFGYKKIVEHLVPLAKKGLKSILLFGILSDSTTKDEVGSLGGGNGKDGPVHLALREIKKELPDLFVICDVCLCEYTSHGHCCVFNSKDALDNDATLTRLVEMSISYIENGANMVAPSDMMDGRIGAIKKAIRELGMEIPVLAYSAKFSSSFYGPFRDVCQSAPQKGDRKGYQLPSDSKELALRAVQRDLEEGADFVMVKPITAYLDIANEIKNKFNCILACYHTSGEYSMVQFADKAGAVEKKKIMLEYMRSFKRAGIDIIITYFTPDLLDWLREEQ